jgi:hypothetical protein
MSNFMNINPSETLRCVLGQADHLLDLEDEGNTILWTSGIIPR